MVLSEQQKQFFEVFGYLHLPGWFTEELPEIECCFSDAMERYADEVFEWNHLGYERQVLLPFIDRYPSLCALFDSSKVSGLVTELLGEDFIFRNSDADIFHGSTDWHNDSWGTPINYRFIKLGIYLEPLRADSGAFRVLPGSHLVGDSFANRLHREVVDNPHPFGLQQAELPGTVLESDPGDLVLFDFRLKHATCGHRFPRRMVCMNFSEGYREEDYPLLRQEVEAIKSLFSLNRIYGETLVESATADRMRHLQPVIDQGGYR